MSDAPPAHRAVTSHRRLAVIWVPGLAVACGAAVATAHGLYEVALAARVPAAIAWLYPLITDGLALVAYAATARLTGPPARYAWVVVVTAAGLSGLAQATWLATDGLAAAPILRFGVGAWPALAAAVVAHLLYLLIDTPHRIANPDEKSGAIAVRPPPPDPVSIPPSNQPSERATDALPSGASSPVSTPVPDPAPPAPTATVRRAPRGRLSSPPGAVRARASTVAQTYLAEHGALPTVRSLMALAEVSRGTAADALTDLRQRPTPLHLVTPENKPPKEHPQP